LDLYEYQGKQLFARQGIPVPEGGVATSPQEARAVAEGIDGKVVIKAQVQVGGRGKAGGIKLADNPAEAEARAQEILGMDIKGHTVHACGWSRRPRSPRSTTRRSPSIARRRSRSSCSRPRVASTSKRSRPTGPRRSRASTSTRSPASSPHHGRWLAYHANIDAEAIRGVVDILERLYKGFVELDAMLMEINPLILTTDGRVIALDAKVTIDGNSLYRHPEMAEYKEMSTQDPQERLAQEKGVTYVKLDGDVGILGNGAGLVMSTLDVVALAGGTPANFLDAGGGSKADEVVAALEVLLSDPKVKSLLVNIFGGITRCDEVAEGLLTALDQLGATLPIVVRLDGTNEEEGRAIIRDRAPENVVVEETMLSAAKRAVELAKEAA